MKPNLVIILADDTGYGDPQCYNPDSLIPTPNIDRLAAEGLRFTDAHSPSAICTPTRYGLLTGRYYWRTPKKHALVMPYEPPVIEPHRPTLPSLLRGAGYSTSCIGKWHLGFHYPARGASERFTQVEADVDFERPLEGGPLDCGFDYFFGTAGCSTSDSPYCFIENRTTVGLPTVPSTPDLHALPGFYPGLMVPDWDEEQVDARLVEKAIARIDTAGEPFLLYLALSAPHNPWLAPGFARGQSDEGPRGDMNVVVDWCVGQIYEALRARGILDRTMVVFTSDNGPMRGENGQRSAGSLRGYKNTAFEGGHRVPFIVRWPEQLASGEVCDDLVCLTDLTATFAALADVELPSTAAEDSHRIAALIPDGAQHGAPSSSPPRALVSDTGGFSSTVGDFAVRWGSWKLIILADRDDDALAQRREPIIDAIDGKLLFDLAADPHETRNLVRDRPQLTAWLEQLLAQLKAGGSRFIEPGEEPSEEPGEPPLFQLR